MSILSLGKVQMIGSKLLWSMIWINGLLFCGLILGLGYIQTPVADDLIYLHWANELGIWDSTMLFRAEWNARWTAVLTNQLYLKLIPNSFVGLSFQITTLMLGMMAFFPISAVLLKSRSTAQRFIFSIYLTLGLFLLCFGVSDSWFWLCAQPAYLWASLIAIWCVFKLLCTEPKPLLFPIFTVAHIYVGGSSELVAISLLLIELSVAITSGYSRLLKPNRLLLVMGIVALMASFVFATFGQGIEVRYAHLSPPGILDGLYLAFNNYLNTIIYGIGKKLPVMAVITISALALRNQAKRPRYDWRIPLGIADGILICTLLITSFTLGEIGPNRAFVHISATLLILCLLAARHVSVPKQISPTIVPVAIVSNLLVGAWLCFTLLIDYPNDVAFSRALKEQNTTIVEQVNSGKNKIKLAPLPSSKYLYRSEISADPENQNNQQLSTIYGKDLKFILVAKP